VEGKRSDRLSQSAVKINQFREEDTRLVTLYAEGKGRGKDCLFYSILEEGKCYNPWKKKIVAIYEREEKKWSCQRRRR